MKFRIVLPLLAALSCALAGAASAANYLVLNNLDSGANSLRAAVQSANASPGLDSISFNILGTITLDSEIVITDDVDIVGPSFVPPAAMLAIDCSGGGGLHRAFQIQPTATMSVTMTRLNILNGRIVGSAADKTGGAIWVNSGSTSGNHLTINNCIFSNCRARIGGAISQNGGWLTVNDSTFSSNLASTSDTSGARTAGGAINSTGNAGGTPVLDTPSTLLNNCTFTYNTANEGGALYGAGYWKIDKCTISNNTASSPATNGYGGAISHPLGGLVEIERSTLNNNTSDYIGGAIYQNGVLFLQNSTLHSNVGVLGGAINLYDIYGGTDKITNCTFYNNTGGNASNVSAGAIHYFGYHMKVYSCTFSENHGIGSGSVSCISKGYHPTNIVRVYLGNTIFDGDGEDTLGYFQTTDAANYYSQGTNIFSDSTPGGGITLGTGDQVGVTDPKLLPLANNGGPTQTMALKTTAPISPALDAGNNALLPPDDADMDGDGNLTEPIPFDQRAYIGRIYNSTTDIGAYEASLPALIINNAASTAEGTSPGAAGSATFTVTLSYIPVSNVTVNYATADGAAVAGSDYVATSGTLTFLPGETSKTITVNFIADSAVESNEPFFVNLSSPSNGYIPTNHVSAVILNDDGPVLYIDDASPVAEGNSGTTSQSFTIHLSMAAATNVTVKWRTSDGTAMTSDSDYTGVPDTVITFTPGQVTKTVTVQVTGDTKVEPNELYHVILSGAGNATIIDNTADAVITNDD